MPSGQANMTDIQPMHLSHVSSGIMGSMMPGTSPGVCTSCRPSFLPSLQQKCSDPSRAQVNQEVCPWSAQTGVSAFSLSCTTLPPLLPSLHFLSSTSLFQPSTLSTCLSYSSNFQRLQSSGLGEWQTWAPQADALWIWCAVGATRAGNP